MDHLCYGKPVEFPPKFHKSFIRNEFVCEILATVKRIRRAQKSKRAHCQIYFETSAIVVYADQ
jgi:hypothetical protein